VPAIRAHGLGGSAPPAFSAAASDQLIKEVRALVRCIQKHVGAPEPDAPDLPGPAAGSVTGTA
jgi:hypothetical protein